ncbi:unnamed protein product [Leptosia nina]|uniref:Uncharacterized protein n=1 Tax=Leptosia nina TaxID=320188 RepID=A0AAV1JVH1_9NEOP
MECEGTRRIALERSGDAHGRAANGGGARPPLAVVCRRNAEKTRQTKNNGTPLPMSPRYEYTGDRVVWEETSLQGGLEVVLKVLYQQSTTSTHSTVPLSHATVQPILQL